MTYLCMTPEEYDLWLEAARAVRNGGRRPCSDCPMAFHLAMKEAGRCDRQPILNGIRYETDDERREAKRRSSRMHMRRARAAA